MDTTKFVEAAIKIADKKGTLPESSDLANALNVSRGEVEAFKKSQAYAELKAVKARFNKKRAEGFKTFANFHKWFVAQPQKCHYCGVSQADLKRLFDKKVCSKKFSASLHIERKDSSKTYAENNCVFACALCNNAKSDMINEANFKKYFAPKIREFIDDLLAGKIENKGA